MGNGYRRTGLLSGGAATMLALAAPGIVCAQEATYSFNLPAADLGTALRAYARITRQQVVFDNARLTGLRSAPLIGTFTASQGLERLLAGSGLAANRTPAGVIYVGSAAGRTADSPAAAQAPPVTTVDELSVTARRRSERLGDVPIAASVLDGDALLDRGPPTDTQALLTGVPGLRFNDTASPTTSELSIRGSGTAQGTSAESGVGLYRNGFYVGGGLQYGRNFLRMDMFDLERVEVLRGTLGALYGRNAVGGAINLISARPQFETTGRVTLDYNPRLERRQAQLVFNAPLSETLAVRFGVDYVEQTDGFYFNKSFDRHLDEQDGFGVRGQLRYRDERVDVTLLTERQEHDVSAIPAALNIPPSVPNFPVGWRQPKYVYTWSIPGDASLDVTNIIATTSVDLGFAEFSSVSAYRARTGLTATDIDHFDAQAKLEQQARGNPMTTIDVGQNLIAPDSTKTYTHEMHLAGAQGSLEWLVGLEYIYQTSELEIVIQRTPGFLGVPLPGIQNDQHLKYYSTAPFVALTYDVSEQFELSAEVRYTKDRKKHESVQFVLGSPNIVLSPLAATDTDYTNVSYNLSAAYRPTDALTAYAKVGSGYRVGGFNPSITNPNQPKPVPPSYDNEVSTTYEVGFKGRAGGWRVGAAGYFTVAKDVLVNDNNGCSLTNACGQGPTQFITNAGKGEVWGVELEARSRFVFDGWTADLAVQASRQEGEYTSGLYAGREIPQTPNWIGSVIVDANAPLGGGFELTGHLIYNLQRGGVQDVAVPSLPVEGRDLINLRVGILKDNWKVEAYVDNILDDEYRIFVQPTLARWNSNRRSAGVSVQYRW